MKKVVSLRAYRKKRNAVKKAKMILCAVALALVVFLLFSIGAKAGKSMKLAKETSLRENRESEFITLSRRYLADNGYVYAGVNLTKTTDDGGEYEYHLLLCHDRFAGMSDDTQFVISRDLEKIKKECSLGRMDVEFR